MKIQKLVIDGLFDLRYEFSFHNDVNFLYGINGSGKTTVLNIISHIISGQLDQLYKYKFDYIQLHASEKDRNELKIIIEQRKGERYLFFSTDGLKGAIPRNSRQYKYRFDNIKPFLLNEAKDFQVYDEFIEDSFKNYSELLKKIKESLSQIYLPLARKNYNNLGEHQEESSSKQSLTDIEKSLEHAVSLVKSRYTKDTYLDNRFLEQLKTQILTQAFNNAFSVEDLLTDELRYTEEEFNEIFDKEFWNTIYDLNLNVRETNEIESDIKSIKDRIRIGENSFILNGDILTVNDSIKFGNYVIAISQLKKNKELVSKVKGINEKRNRVKYTLNQLVNIVNRFFNDSNKEVQIDKEGILKFKRKNSSKLNEVNVMSSGEKQILIFFIYAILQTKKSGIFMIDEPELSLHLQWQHIFVDSLMEIRPDVQLILATHSPEIIGRYRNRCIEVRGV